MSNAVVALLVFSALLWSNAQAFNSIAADCCLTTSENLVPRRIVKSYLIQNSDNECPISATVFITKKGRRLCAPPVTDLRYHWVLKLVEYLDNRNGDQ